MIQVESRCTRERGRRGRRPVDRVAQANQLMEVDREVREV